MRKLVLLAIAAIVAAGAPAAAQDKVRVSVPQRGLWDTGVSELGRRAGIFQKHGLDLDILFTSGGAESQQAVIGGSMDIAVGVGVSGAIGAFAKGAPLRLIGSEMIGSPDLYWYVVPASPVRVIADFTGKSMGFSVTGSSSHAGLLEFARQNKLNVKPVSTGGMPATLTQVMTGQIDVGWAAVPFGIDALEGGRIRLVARGYDVEALKGRTTRVNVSGLDMLTKRRDALDRYMRAYRETIDWMYSDDFRGVAALCRIFRLPRAGGEARARIHPQGGHDARPGHGHGRDRLGRDQAALSRPGAHAGADRRVRANPRGTVTRTT